MNTLQIYEEQLVHERAWVTLILAAADKTPEQKCQALADRCIYFAGCYVNGSNIIGLEARISTLELAIQGMINKSDYGALAKAIEALSPETRQKMKNAALQKKGEE
jgi:hypothetical protein